MVWIGVMTEIDAFGLVDWNVMAILVSVWVIAGYFGKTGVPSWLSVQALQLSGGRPGLLVMILSVLAGVISMFVDNVVVILMMAPVALPLARALKLPVTPLVLMIGFAANFMGSAMLLGDLPPQMLHSVAGAEFMDFFWQHGRPSSFPILMVTFVDHAGRDVRLRLSRRRRAGAWTSTRWASRRTSRTSCSPPSSSAGSWRPCWAWRSARCSASSSASSRMTGAITLVLMLEILGKRVKAPSFEDILGELDWRAIFFYIALFALVGGLEKMHILDAARATAAADLHREPTRSARRCSTGSPCRSSASSSTTPTS